MFPLWWKNYRKEGNDEKLEGTPAIRTADKLNNAATILIFIITFINVILNAFDLSRDIVNTASKPGKTAKE